MKVAVATGGDISSFRAHSIAVMKTAEGFNRFGHIKNLIPDSKRVIRLQKTYDCDIH